MTIGGRREKRELLGLTRRLTMNDWVIDEGCEEAWLATVKLKGTGGYYLLGSDPSRVPIIRKRLIWYGVGGWDGAVSSHRMES